MSDASLRSFLRAAPFALHFIYDHTPTELQLRAAQRGWHLLFMRATSMPEEPAFAVFAQVGAGVEDFRCGGACARARRHPPTPPTLR